MSRYVYTYVCMNMNISGPQVLYFRLCQSRANAAQQYHMLYSQRLPLARNADAYTPCPRPWPAGGTCWLPGKHVNTRPPNLSWLSGMTCRRTAFPFRVFDQAWTRRSGHNSQYNWARRRRCPLQLSVAWNTGMDCSIVPHAQWTTLPSRKALKGTRYVVYRYLN